MGMPWDKGEHQQLQEQDPQPITPPLLLLLGLGRVLGPGAAMGEGSELGELTMPNLGGFFCKPHRPEEQSLAEGRLGLGVCACSGSAWEGLNSKFLIREANEQP